MQHLKGFASLAERFDGFIIDLWGVVHDGVTPYPGAIDCLRRLRAAGKRTVLLSSHLLNEVEQICTRIGVIRRGSLVAEGTIDEIRGGSHLVVRATPLDDAKRILEQAVGADKVSVRDGAFSLNVEMSQTADIARRLVTGGVELTELRPGERSLEDVFIELTGTESGS